MSFLWIFISALANLLAVSIVLFLCSRAEKSKPFSEQEKPFKSLFLQEKNACQHCGLVNWQYPICPKCDTGKPLRAEGFSCNPMFESIHFVCDTCKFEKAIQTKFDIEFMKSRRY